MNLNIRITGPAGAGVNSTVDIISEIFCELGYDLITDIEYESRIKGGVNFFDVHISDSQDIFLTQKVDILLAFNAESLEKQMPALTENACIISNSKWISKLETTHIGKIQEKFHIIQMEIADKYDNTYLLGLMGQYLGIEQDIILAKIEKIFQKKGSQIIEHNKNIVKNIYQDTNNKQFFNVKIKQLGPKKHIIYGNKAIALGAIQGGLGFYAGYPMTPASSIMTEIILDNTVPCLQTEDEIAAINAVLGASFTGTRAMTGTSGGGFALMTEAISFAVQAEFPMTIALSQRAGPSTGTPTYHEQGDINYALNPSFGDFQHVVLSPSSIEEAHFFGCLALNIADKYQTQVILLIDKQISEIVATHEELKIPKIDRGIILENPGLDYKRYALTETGISPRVIVGTQNGDFIASSYEHDEYGATSEDSKNKEMFTQKRFKKLNNFFEKEGYRGYEIMNKNAEKIIVTMSATSYTAKYFIKKNPEFGLLIIKFLKPLDEKIREELIGKKEIIFVENNYSGQLQHYITHEFGLQCIPTLTIKHLRKYDLMPFYIEDFNTLKQ